MNNKIDAYNMETQRLNKSIMDKCVDKYIDKGVFEEFSKDGTFLRKKDPHKTPKSDTSAVLLKYYGIFIL